MIGSISIEFGALADPISEQLTNQGVKVTDVEAGRFDALADGIILLHLNDLIPDSVRDNAQKKLMKQISRVINKCEQ